MTTIQELKLEMIQAQKLCMRGIHDVTPVDKKAVPHLFQIKKKLLTFLEENPDSTDALRFMYFVECYLLNFRTARTYLEKVCILSGDRKDKMNLIGLGEILSKVKEVVLQPEEVFELHHYLDKQLEEHVCDHSLRFTKQWLTENNFQSKSAQIIRGLRNQGGYCDCEVLVNVFG